MGQLNRQGLDRVWGKIGEYLSVSFSQFTSTIQDKLNAKADKKNGIYYIVGNTNDSAITGVWLGECDDITEYYDGLTIAYKVPVAGVSSGVTLNINDFGAVTVVRNATTAISTAYPVGAVALFTYTTDTDANGNPTAYWKAADYDANTTYTNVKLGHGYCTCSTAASTAAKTASLSSYTLSTGGRVTVRFTNGITVAKPTLNINSKGAKKIYWNNAQLTDTTLIQPGDMVTFVYSTYYHIVNIQRHSMTADRVLISQANGMATESNIVVDAEGNVSIEGNLSVGGESVATTSDVTAAIGDAMAASY